MQMPKPDQDLLAKRARIVDALRAIVPGEGVIASQDELRAYECDGADRLSHRAHGRGAAVDDRRRSSRILRCCDAEKVKVVPRGAGTSLSGGALPLTDGIVLGLGKFNRSSTSTTRTAPSPPSPASPISASPRRSSIGASTTPPIPPRRSPAPSAATSPRTPAACTA